MGLNHPGAGWSGLEPAGWSAGVCVCVCMCRHSAVSSRPELSPQAERVCSPRYVALRGGMDRVLRGSGGGGTGAGAGAELLGLIGWSWSLSWSSCWSWRGRRASGAVSRGVIWSGGFRLAVHGTVDHSVGWRHRTATTHYTVTALHNHLHGSWAGCTLQARIAESAVGRPHSVRNVWSKRCQNDVDFSTMVLRTTF